MKKILLTGASGFVGKHLVEKARDSYHVSLIQRKGSAINSGSYIYKNMNAKSDFLPALTGVDCIVHLAAMAHVLTENSSFALEQFRIVNRDLTVRLAEQAASNGIKRFIYISSIGVNGVRNSESFRSSDRPKPSENYSISKLEAEIELKKIAKNTGMEVVIIRPPLVYGKGAPGNFGTLLKVAQKNLPLPLGAINNRRSFVSIDNLIDLIITCIDHPNAANQIFLVSDDEDISTSNLLKKLTLAAGKKPWLLPVPVSFLKLLATMVGKKAVVERFSNSLTVDIEHTKKTLNWKPPITLDEGIRRCFK